MTFLGSGSPALEIWWSWEMPTGGLDVANYQNSFHKVKPGLSESHIIYNYIFNAKS